MHICDINPRAHTHSRTLTRIRTHAHMHTRTHIHTCMYSVYTYALFFSLFSPASVCLSVFLSNTLGKRPPTCPPPPPPSCTVSPTPPLSPLISLCHCLSFSHVVMLTLQTHTRYQLRSPDDRGTVTHGDKQRPGTSPQTRRLASKSNLLRSWPVALSHVYMYTYHVCMRE